MSWDNTPIIDSVQLPGSDTKYFVADAEARDKIDALVSATHFIGVSSTEITDGGNESPTIGGETVTPAAGDIVIYKPLTGSALEFIWDPSGNLTHPSGCWQLLGGESVDNLGDLAYKNSASGSYTPEGSVNLTLSTTEVISSVSRGTLGIDLTLSDTSAEDFSVVTISGSVDSSLSYPTVVTSLTSNALSIYSYDIAFRQSETSDVVTSVGTNSVTVVNGLTSGILPTISNQNTLTATMGTGSSSTTLIFNLSSIGFNAGEFPDIITTTVDEVSSVEGRLLSVTKVLDSNYTVYTSYSTQDLVIPYEETFTASIYYKADITGQFETSTADVVTGLSATFSGSASTIIVS